MKTIAFFSDRAGVGTTSLVYHLAWMFADLGVSVMAADLDPQANLTSMFLEDDRLQSFWPPSASGRPTVYGSLRSVLGGAEDVLPPHVELLPSSLSLLVGDLALSVAEEEFSAQWLRCLEREPHAFHVHSALAQTLKGATEYAGADLVLIDLGPNLGAFNRAGLITADHVVVPLAPERFSVEGLSILGPTLSRWRTEWAERRSRNPVEGLELPRGEMRPLGYVVMQHAVRLDRPVNAYARWIERIPRVYREAVVKEDCPTGLTIEDDQHSLATLKHYRSLMPLAQEARKPMFHLQAADGALGGHAKAVRDCYTDFRSLARTIADRINVRLA